jgi:hypothetical protein
MGQSKRRKQRAEIGDGGAQPYWAPAARPNFTHAQQASIVARNLVPLACLAVFGGSVLQFLLLSVFNLAFTIAGIGTVGVAVSTRQEVTSTGVADQLGALVTLAAVCIGASLVLSVLFGWVIAVFAADEAQGLWDRTLWLSVLGIVVAALPGMVMQYRQDLLANLSEDERKRRDQPAVGVHLFSALFIFILSAYTLDWGRLGAVLMALAVTALFIFRDLRPDLARALTRPGR